MCAEVVSYMYGKFFKSDQSHASQKEDPESQCDGGQQSCHDNDTGGQDTVIAHVFGHDVTGNRCRRTNHNEDGHQSTFAEAHGNGKWKIDGR